MQHVRFFRTTTNFVFFTLQRIFASVTYIFSHFSFPNFCSFSSISILSSTPFFLILSQEHKKETFFRLRFCVGLGTVHVPSFKFFNGFNYWPLTKHHGIPKTQYISWCYVSRVHYFQGTCFTIVSSANDYTQDTISSSALFCYVLEMKFFPNFILTDYDLSWVFTSPAPCPEQEALQARYPLKRELLSIHFVSRLISTSYQNSTR